MYVLDPDRHSKDEDVRDGSDDTCGTISFSLRHDNTSVHGPPNLSLGKRLMRRCLNAYPEGTIFFLRDGDAPESSGSEGSATALPSEGYERTRKRHPKVSTRKAIVSHLMEVLPQACTVVFMPIWDFRRDEWLAASFVWTLKVGHLTDPQVELPYLRALASSLVSENTRLATVKSDQAKTTFIASISHELRSPLHGILGSVEFLNDTYLNSFQTGLVTQVETSGRTLLDTMDHLLHYAKINNFTSSLSRRHQLGSRRPTSAIDNLAMTNTSVDVDLSLVLEEVCEAIFAGTTFLRRQQNQQLNIESSKTWARTDKSAPAFVTASTGYGEEDGSIMGLTVVLSIAKGDHWYVRTQPGALRRIIMNLIGNALKYTEKGYVLVSLGMQPRRARYGHRTIEIKVEDTGKGMSEEFLRSHVFRPFTQEDPFSAG